MMFWHEPFPPTTSPIETLPFTASMTVLKWISRVTPNIVPVNLKLLTKLWWILGEKWNWTDVWYVSFYVTVFLNILVQTFPNGLSIDFGHLGDFKLTGRKYSTTATGGTWQLRKMQSWQHKVENAIFIWERRNINSWLEGSSHQNDGIVVTQHCVDKHEQVYPHWRRTDVTTSQFFLTHGRMDDVLFYSTLSMLVRYNDNLLCNKFNS